MWKWKITLAYWWSIIQDWPFYDGRSNEPLLYLFHFRTLLFQLPFTAGLINMIPRFVVCINAVHDFWWSMCFCVYRVFFINWYFERLLNYAGTHHQPFSDTTNDFGWPSLIRPWVNDGHYWIYQIRALHWSKMLLYHQKSKWILRYAIKIIHIQSHSKSSHDSFQK